MYFRYFIIISPWKRMVPFIWIWTPSPKNAFAMFGFRIGSVVLEKKIFKFRQCIFSIKNYLPLEKGGALHLDKLESPSPKDALCQVLLKLAQWFWGRRFFLISTMYFPYFVIIFHWKRAGPLLWIPLTQGCFVASLVEIGPVVLKKKIF